MVEVISYVKQGDDFIPVSTFGANLRDPDYIDGAIELVINHRPILTTAMWDLVDQLWSYIAGGLTDVVQGKPFFTHFPDQPAELHITPVNPYMVKVRTVAGGVSRSEVVALDELIDTLSREGISFFGKMCDLNPAHSVSYQHSIHVLESLQSPVRVD